ncbi:acyl carrier protein [Schlesneria paludicola]|uniref:acyl carrier protein n=1 Tax=Schlesneria paludicola TaxID=360056 RepID=UPI00029B141B|nr:phosphopantetheine-binding protein [Schlesneria paludicola]
MNQPIENRLVDFLRSMTGQKSLVAETDLFEAGVTDSLTIMDLLVFVETEFQIQIGFEHLTPETFETPRTLANLIMRQLAGNSHSAAA